MVIKYTNICHCKNLQNGIFGLKTNHLATLVNIANIFAEFSSKSQPWSLVMFMEVALKISVSLKLKFML
jgi:hypothetical protein